MIKWKTLLLEVAALGCIALAVYMYAHTPAPMALWHKMGAPVTGAVTETATTFDSNAGRPTEAAPTPPRETASPTRTRHRGTRRRGMPRTRSPAGKVPYWAPQQIPRKSLDIRSPVQRRGSKTICSQVPAMAYQMDRATLISAARAYGATDAQIAELLRCTGK